jgi:FkbM family methyltransferase
VHAPLVPLLASLPGKFSLIKKGQPLPPFDLHCPVMSLPLAFKTTLATIPAAVPYLHADTDKREARRRLGDATKPRIGLVWSGSAAHKNDHNRSISLQQLKPLLQLPLEFHSLQCEVRAEDAAVLAASGQVHLHQGELNDFSDTAALVQEMDLIISVDTSVAHLAGALAKPVWIMLPFKPDYRWMLERSDSPWYPTATLFRQPVAGDWTSVIAAIESKLQSGYCFVKGLKRTDTMTENQTTNHAAGQNSKQLLEQAVAAQKTGQLQSAKALYLSFLQAEPSHPAANHNMGVLMLEMGQAEESLQYFSAALDADPSSGHLWLGYIEALSRAGQADEAKQILALARKQGLEGEEVEALAARLEGGTTPVAATERLAAMPDEQEVDDLLALFGQGRFAEAADFARSLTARFPQDGFGWKVLGAVLKQMGSNAVALTPMQKAAWLMPGDVEVHYNLGVVLQDLGRSEEAEASYRQALAINPEYADAYNNLGVVLHGRGKLEEAAASFRRALQIKPDYASARGNLDAVLQALAQPTAGDAGGAQSVSREPLSGSVNPYQLVAARHGRFLVSPHDVYLGRAVIEYGEYGEIEWKFLEQLMRSGMDAIEVGANIGTHTVSMASKLAGMGRRLLAVEPQPVVFQNMCANIALNGLFNVIAENAACSDTLGELTFQAPDYFRENNSGGVSMREDGSGNRRVRSLPLDDLVPPEFDVGLIKIDVEGFEQKVLEGAVKTIARFRPTIYVENDRIEKSKALIEWLWAAGYKMWWHIPFLFNPENFAGNSENIYGNVGSFNMLALPNESTMEVKGYARVEDSGAHPLQR